MRLAMCAIVLAFAPAFLAGCAGAATYADPVSGFTIQYLDTAQMVRQDFAQYLPLTQSGVIGFTLATAPFAGTNLASAGVYIGASADPAAVSACPMPAADRGEISAGSVTVNGARFAVLTLDESAAGNFYDSKIYRAVHNAVCYELVELTHSHDIGAYTPGSVREFDAASVSAALDAMVHSFAFGR